MIEQETEILDVDQINAALNDDPVLRRGAGAGKKGFIIPTAIFTVISIICCIIIWILAISTRTAIIKEGGIDAAIANFVIIILFIVLMGLATVLSLVFSIIGTVLSSIMIRSNKEYHYNMAYPIVMTALNVVIIISYIVAWIVAFAA